MIPENAGSLMWIGMKLMVLLGILIYIVFAGIIVRQEQLMVKTMEAASEKILSFFVWLHLAIAIVIFFFALTIL